MHEDPLPQPSSVRLLPPWRPPAPPGTGEGPGGEGSGLGGGESLARCLGQLQPTLDLIRVCLMTRAALTLGAQSAGDQASERLEMLLADLTLADLKAGVAPSRAGEPEGGRIQAYLEALQRDAVSQVDELQRLLAYGQKRLLGADLGTFQEELLGVALDGPLPDFTEASNLAPKPELVLQEEYQFAAAGRLEWCRSLPPWTFLRILLDDFLDTLTSLACYTTPRAFERSVGWNFAALLTAATSAQDRRGSSPLEP